MKPGTLSGRQTHGSLALGQILNCCACNYAIEYGSWGATGDCTFAHANILVYDRRSFDGPGQVFKMTPLKPLAKLRDEALAARPPIEKGTFRDPELVQLNELDPTIKLDIRYASSRNFLGAPLYLKARAYMQRPAAEAIVSASQRCMRWATG